MPWKRRRSRTGDTFCRQDADHSLMDGAVPAAFSFAGAYLRSLSIPASAMPPRKPHVQRGLAFSKRECRLRVCDFADLRGCRLFKVQRLRSDQLGRALLGASVPADTGGSEQILLETGRKPARHCSAGSEDRRARCRRRAVSAALLAPRADVRSLSVPVPSIHSRKSPEQRGLGFLSEEKTTPSATSCHDGK